MELALVGVAYPIDAEGAAHVRCTLGHQNQMVVVVWSLRIAHPWLAAPVSTSELHVYLFSRVKVSIQVARRPS